MTEWEAKHSFEYSKCLFDELLHHPNSTAILLSIISFVTFGLVGSKRMASLAVLFLVSALISACVTTWRKKLSHEERLQVVKAHRNRLKTLKAGLVLSELPPSSSLIQTFRDGFWSQIPSNALVEGDIIQLTTGDIAPCRLKSVNFVKGKQSSTSSSSSSSRKKHTPAYSLRRGQRCPSAVPSRTRSHGAPLTNVSSGYRFRKSNSSMLKIRNVRFRVLETPALFQLEDILSTPVSSQVPKSVIDTQINTIQSIVLKLLLCGVSLSFIINLIRLIIIEGDGDGRNEVWMEQLLLAHVLLSIPLLGLSNSLWMFLVNSFGNAYILATHHYIENSTTDLLYGSTNPKPRNRRRSHSTSEVTGGGPGGVGGDDTNPDDVRLEHGRLGDVHMVSLFLQHMKIDTKKLIVYARSILSGNYDSHPNHEVGIGRPHTVNMLHRLGSVTVFCCLDKSGVLAESTPFVEHVLFMDGPPETNKSVILDLLPDSSTENGIVIEGEWRGYLGCLKPIGLSVLLNTECTQHKKVKPNKNLWLGTYNYEHVQMMKEQSTNPHHPQHHHHHHHHTDPRYRYARSQYKRSALKSPQPCICPLGREIGFNVQDTRHKHTVLKRLFTSHETINVEGEERKIDILRSSGIVVSNKVKPSELQIMNQGDPELLFKQCTTYWSGVEKGIRPMTEEQIKHMSSVVHQWKHQNLQCIAFCYNPIPSSMNPLFSLDSVGGDIYLSEPNQAIQALPISMQSPSYGGMNTPNSDASHSLTSSPVTRPVPVVKDGNGNDMTTTSTVPIGGSNSASVLNRKTPQRVAFALDSPSGVGTDVGTGNRDLTTGERKTSASATSENKSGSTGDEDHDLEVEESATSGHLESDNRNENSTNNNQNDTTDNTDNTDVDEASPSVSDRKTVRNNQREEEIVEEEEEKQQQQQTTQPLPSSSSSSSSNFMNSSVAVPGSGSSGNWKRWISDPHHKRSGSRSQDGSAFGRPSIGVGAGLDESLVPAALPPPINNKESKRLPDHVWLADTLPGTENCTSLSQVLDTRDASLLQLQRSQIFLGMAALRNQPKAEVLGLVDEMHDAGVRFVYFSHGTERMSKPFCDQIGIETDWNAFISLKDTTNATGSPAVQGASKLPRGVSKIREHLEEVDNVPLLVSLFTDCESESMAEMIRIYQENGETVLSLGSSLRTSNSNVFLQSDIAIAIDPVPPGVCRSQTKTRSKKRKTGTFQQTHYTGTTEFAASRAITSLPCSLQLQSGTNLHEMSALIAVARRFLLNYRQGLSFALACFLSLFFLLFVSSVANTPPPINGYQLMWLVWIIIPFLSASLFWSEPDSELMQTVADKNEEVLADRWRMLSYVVLRFFPSTIVHLLLFLWILHENKPVGSFIYSNFYWDISGNDLVGEPEWDSAVLEAQNYTLVALVYFFCVLSMNFVHRTSSIFSFNPFTKNRFWFFSSLFSFFLQVLFCIFSVASSSDFDSLSNIPPFAYLVVVVWSVGIIATDTVVKSHDYQKLKRYRKRNRLIFDTKLGMHSPK